MNPAKKYNIIFIKTVFTHLTILGLIFSGFIIYNIIQNKDINNLIQKINSILFYANNLILFLLIGIFYLSKANKEEIDI